MKRIAFFDTKPYDKIWFEKMKDQYPFEIKYNEYKLNKETVVLASDCDGVVAFVNDIIDAPVIDWLYNHKINIVAMRCAGYNNVDFKSAFGKVHVTTVPAYSPHSVAEHAMALLLTHVRKIHRAYIRTRDNNFNISGLTGFDLFGKTVGIIGTGKIGKVFADICKGFGMNILAYDPFPAESSFIKYVSLDKLYKNSDIISIHCPLSDKTYHIVDKSSFESMKKNVIIINTSRGALIDSEALLCALKNEQIAGAVLDVYEEEDEYFFEDMSGLIIHDDVLSGLIALPNVIVTSHQAFLTNEALEAIAKTTLDNLLSYFESEKIKNEICYDCMAKKDCKKEGNCF